MKILYGIAGEGLGHATRAHAVIEEMGEECVFIIYTFGAAYRYFERMIASGAKNLLLHRIDGIEFNRRDNRISLPSTLTGYLKYRHRDMRLDCERIRDGIRRYRPDLVVTDYEPSSARAARQEEVPLISIDNQHKFSHFSSKELPLRLRLYCHFISAFTGWHIGKTDDCVISTFYHELGRLTSNVHKANVFLRREVGNLEATDGDHVLVYWKPSVGWSMLRFLDGCGFPVKVYGSELKLYNGENMSFHPLDYSSFAKDLASCRAVFCAAGNQLLGEACYFNKPTFTVPEPNQYEQSINAYYAEQMGFARAYQEGKYGQKEVQDFLDNFSVKPRRRPNGVVQAAKVIRTWAK